MARKYYELKLILRVLICICAILFYTVSSMHTITVRVISGVYILCMILHMANQTPLKKSHIQFVHWNSFHTGHYMIG
ncbi:Uncharacterised protein [Mycobacterium tuberculosis]|nr:Uncharacterised protein [Mycobacterium tuberculosis]